MGNITKFIYSGHVNLKIKIGDQIYEMNNHNEGTPFLMRSFAKFLAGEMNIESDTPQFLDLQKGKDSGDGKLKWETYLTKTVELTGREWYQNGLDTFACKFTATIPYTALSAGISSDDQSKFRLSLYSYEGADKIDLAYLGVTAQSLCRIAPGTQAIIEWVMEVNNEEVK